MYMKDLPASITNFHFQAEALAGPDKQPVEWLQITRVTNVGSYDKEIKQKVIRLSPEDQLTLFRMLSERFE